MTKRSNIVPFVYSLVRMNLSLHPITSVDYETLGGLDWKMHAASVYKKFRKLHPDWNVTYKRRGEDIVFFRGVPRPKAPIVNKQKIVEVETKRWGWVKIEFITTLNSCKSSHEEELFNAHLQGRIGLDMIELDEFFEFYMGLHDE